MVQTAASTPVLNVADVVELERRIAASGTTLAQLMRAAGTAVADAVRALEPEPCPVCVLAGSGNNGGDGWVAAELLAEAGYPVTVITSKTPDAIEAQPAHDAAIAAIAAGGDKIDVQVLPNNGVVANALHRTSVIVDALLGTGFDGGTVHPGLAAWIGRANSARSTYGVKIVAADVPSGVSAQTGRFDENTIKADVTVTMMVGKPGLLIPAAAAYCGRIEVVDICDLTPFADFIEEKRVR